MKWASFWQREPVSIVCLSSVGAVSLVDSMRHSLKPETIFVPFIVI